MQKKNTPDVKIIKHDNFFRHELISFLNGNNNIGIELGVAGGHYSKRMVDSGKFSKFYGVDSYCDHHDVFEYIGALKLIGLDNNYKLLRMSFDDALNLFPNNLIDIIYFDGYAHTGEEGGKVFSDWWKKLKLGGIFAGDDYDDQWPLVKWGVNHMVKQIDCELHLTGKVENLHQHRYPSWFFMKSQDIELIPNYELLEFVERFKAELGQFCSPELKILKEQEKNEGSISV